MSVFALTLAYEYRRSSSLLELNTQKVHFFAFLIASCVFAFSIFSFTCCFFVLLLGCRCQRTARLCVGVNVLVYRLNLSLLYAQRERYTSFPFEWCARQDRFCLRSISFCFDLIRQRNIHDLKTLVRPVVFCLYFRFNEVFDYFKSVYKWVFMQLELQLVLNNRVQNEEKNHIRKVTGIALG